MVIGLTTNTVGLLCMKNSFFISALNFGIEVKHNSRDRVSHYVIINYTEMSRSRQSVFLKCMHTRSVNVKAAGSTDCTVDHECSLHHQLVCIIM